MGVVQSTSLLSFEMYRRLCHALTGADSLAAKYLSNHHNDANDNDDDDDDNADDGAPQSIDEQEEEVVEDDNVRLPT